MATVRAKALRRGLALNRLDELARQLGERLKVQVPNLRPISNHDHELEQIIQMEAINALLGSVVDALDKKKKAA